MANLKGSLFFKAIGLIILAFILYLVDLSEVWRQLKLSDPILIATAIGLILPQVALRAYRWQQMLASENIKCPLRLALSFYFAGIYIGLMTPGRIGEMAKAFLLKNRNIASISQSLPSIIADRCLDLYCLSLVAVISFCFLGIGVGSLKVGILITLAVGGTPWLLIYIWRSGRLANWIFNLITTRWGDKWGGTFESFSEVAERLISKRMTYMMALTIASYGVYFLQTWLIGCSVGLALNYTTVAMAVSIAILIGYVPITIAGLGTREAVLIYIFEHFGVPAASTLSFAIIYNLVYIVCMGGVSALFWLTIPPTERFLKRPGTD